MNLRSWRQGMHRGIGQFRPESISLQRIEWNSRERDTELCLVKGKSEEDCNNYIRVLAKQDNTSLLVCGTNSYNPRCRSYLRNKDGSYEVAREQSGRGYCPYDPRHNSTFMFTGELIFLTPLLHFNTLQLFLYALRST